MFHKAEQLQFKSGTNLEVTFQDGVVKRFDVSLLFVKYPQMEALSDRKLFTSGRLMGSYGIVWNDELDLETETVYEEGTTVRRTAPRPRCCIMIGAEVAKARAQEAISQKELSRRTGIDQSDLSKIERGLANPSVETLNRIAEALHCRLVISMEPAEAMRE